MTEPGGTVNRGGRMRRLALLVAAPALAAAIGTACLEAWRLFRPAAPLFATPGADSLVEAIERHDVRAASVFVRAGQDPNGYVGVRHPVLTGNRWVVVSPLLWAVAVQDPPSVLMLIGFGARTDSADARSAVCLAEQLGDAAIAGALRQYVAAPAAACAPAEDRHDILLRFALISQGDR